MPLFEADAPLSRWESTFHRPPAVHVTVDIDRCGVATIVATPRKDGWATVIAADGEMLVGGVGAQTWTGPVPRSRDSGERLVVTATAEPPRGSALATAEVRPADALVATLEVSAAAGSYRPMEARVGLGAGCTAGSAGYDVFVDQGQLASAEGTVPLGQIATVAFSPWEGSHTVSGWMRLHGWRVPLPPVRFDVQRLPLDLDRDGATDDVDCDDADPFSRPGLPDIAYDGRDNDCDGALAGDADHDGYDANRARPKRLDAAQRTAIAAASPDAATWEAGLLRAARLRDADCADDDPARNPGAYEVDDARDDDCDGKTLFDPAVRLGSPDLEDAGATFATATWLGAGPQESVLELGPGDVDVLAFRQPGVTSVTRLSLVVTATAPVWVELWSGGPVRDPERVVVGPRPEPYPIFRARVTPADALVLPPPPKPSATPSSPAAPGKERTWTGALWRGVTSLFDGDGQIDPGEVLLSFGAALYVTPITAIMDYADWEARRSGAAVPVAEPAAEPVDALALDDGELLYLVVRGVPPVAVGAGARVKLGR